MKKSKHHWQETIAQIAEQMPAAMRPDDHTMLTVLTDVIHAEQIRMKHQNLGVLVGLAAELLKRLHDAMPKASHVNAEGQPVYTEADVAAHLGISIEEVRRAATEMAELPDSERYVQTVDADTVHRIN